MKRLLPLFLCLSLSLIASCSRQETEPAPAPRRLTVVTTLFPLYDFARNIGGDLAAVSLLLPPGVEPHSFDPQPDDVLRINRADLFVYTHPAMEPWAVRVAATVDAARVRIVDASAGTRLRQASAVHAEKGGHDHDHHHRDAGAIDPHLWLDFANAAVMVDNLAAAMAAADPGHRDTYLANAESYREQLAGLDEKYRATLAGCPGKVLLHGGHFAFGYLAARYGLDYRAAAAVSPDAEPTPARMAELVRQMRANRLNYIFSEELVAPRVAETLARETGAAILPLSAAHNLSREEFAGGVTFIAVMERNLANLATGLGCR
jgi:zinc transport system substrate-binding protein